MRVNVPWELDRMWFSAAGRRLHAVGRPPGAAKRRTAHLRPREPSMAGGFPAGAAARREPGPDGSRGVSSPADVRPGRRSRRRPRQIVSWTRSTVGSSAGWPRRARSPCSTRGFSRDGRSGGHHVGQRGLVWSVAARELPRSCAGTSESCWTRPSTRRRDALHRRAGRDDPHLDLLATAGGDPRPVVSGAIGSRASRPRSPGRDAAVLT